ncbi:hypothetical protein FACS189472_11370 [Alphaproteobacteria bacterium]|nr:hypothetical protein FACS189472_11370 [Alphaproteobacteria bacterium]
MKKILCVCVFSFLQFSDGYACSIPVPRVDYGRIHLKETLNVSDVLNTLSGNCPILSSIGNPSQIAKGNKFIEVVFWDAIRAIISCAPEERHISKHISDLKNCETFDFMKSFLGKALSSNNDIQRVLVVACSKMTGTATQIKMPFYSSDGTCGAKEYNQLDVRYIFSGIKRILDRLHELEQTGKSDIAEYAAGKMQIAKLMGLLIRGYNESPAEIYAAHTACVSDLLQSEKLDDLSWQNCLKALVLDMLLSTRSKLFKFFLLRHKFAEDGDIFDDEGLTDDSVIADADSSMEELGVHQLLEGIYGINAPQGNPWTNTHHETRQRLLIYLLNARRTNSDIRNALSALAMNPKTKKWGPSGVREFSWHGKPLTPNPASS